MSGSLDCTNCYMTNNVIVSNLVIGIAWNQLNHFSVNMSGTSYINTVLDLRANLDYQNSGTQTLWPKTAVPQLGFSLGLCHYAPVFFRLC